MHFLKSQTNQLNLSENIAKFNHDKKKKKSKQTVGSVNTQELYCTVQF